MWPYWFNLRKISIYITIRHYKSFVDIHIYFVIFGFIFILIFVSKLVIEINQARKNIISINSNLDDASEEIVSLKKELDLLKKTKY